MHDAACKWGSWLHSSHRSLLWDVQCARAFSFGDTLCLLQMTACLIKARNVTDTCQIREQIGWDIQA